MDILKIVFGRKKVAADVEPAEPQEDRLKLVRRAAFHEAGHLLVAVRLSVKILRNIGICIDDCGRGYAATCLRHNPSDDFPVPRKIEVKVLLAGRIAEKQFDPKSSGNSAKGDENRIRELQAEDPNLSNLTPLEEASQKLIKADWVVIKRLAERLLMKKLQPRLEREPWTECEFARYLSGDEISEVLPEASGLLVGGVKD
jgi:hypothetical protein